MNKNQYNILVVPGGSGMAIAAVKMFKKDAKMNIIAVDTNNLSPGLYLAHKGYIIPPFKDTPFYSVIKNIVKKEKIDLIIPALDTILLEFSEKREEFEKLGAKVLVSEPKTIKITRDKWKTYNELKDIIPFPQSFINKKDINIDFPLIMKPRRGSGSKDVYKITSNRELDFFYKRVENPIIQEYLEGKEYTVDCLADMKGNLLICIPRERIEMKAGISVKGRIVKDERLDEIAIKISKHIRFTGPFFFQVKEDREGVFKLMEINPRISGTMSLSSSSGPNIHNLAVRLIFGEKINIPKIKYGLYVTRYWEDIYLTKEELKKHLKEIE